MHDSVAFYVDDLDDHLTTWTNNDVGTLKYYYTNPQCGSTMYVTFITTPNTGDMIEVHSGSATGFESLFDTSFEDMNSSCAESYYPTNSLEELQELWTDEQGDDDSDVLPELLPIRFMIPASQFDDVDNLLDLESELVGTFETTTSDSCAYRSSKQSLYSSNVTIDFRIVHNWDAKDNTDGLDLETYETYVKDVRNEYWGYDRGWDRYIDNHIGWYLPTRTDSTTGDDDGAYYTKYKLDKLGPSLKENEIKYKGHYSGEVNTNSGSIWTAFMAGGGVGVEFAGNYDWSYFNTTDTTYLSFCDASSVGAAAKITIGDGTDDASISQK